MAENLAALKVDTSAVHSVELRAAYLVVNLAGPLVPRWVGNWVVYLVVKKVVELVDSRAAR
jgi:hypothetical protein